MVGVCPCCSADSPCGLPTIAPKAEQHIIPSSFETTIPIFSQLNETRQIGLIKFARNTFSTDTQLTIGAVELESIQGSAFAAILSQQVVSPMVSLTVNTDEPFRHTVEIQLLIPTLPTSSLALSFLSEDRSEWVIEDSPLELIELSNFTMFGKGQTTHFSIFAVLVGSSSSSRDIEEEQDTDGGDSAELEVILGVTFGVLAVILVGIVVVGLVFWLVRVRKRRTFKSERLQEVSF